MKKDDFEALGRGFGADGALGRIDTHTLTPHHANLTTKAASKSVLGAYYTDRLGKRRSVKNGPTLCQMGLEVPKSIYSCKIIF